MGCGTAPSNIILLQVLYMSAMYQTIHILWCNNNIKWLTECHMLIFWAQGKWSLWYSVVVSNTEFVFWVPRVLRCGYVNSTCCYCIIWCVTQADVCCWVAEQFPIIFYHSHVDKIRVGCNLTFKVDMTPNINIYMSCVAGADLGLWNNICGKERKKTSIGMPATLIPHQKRGC